MGLSLRARVRACPYVCGGRRPGLRRDTVARSVGVPALREIFQEVRV